MSALTLNEYQALAARTANPAMPLDDRRQIAALGIVGEVGELCDLIKKIEGHGHPEDKAAIAKECGDVLWYCAEMASACALGLGVICTAADFETLMIVGRERAHLTRIEAALSLGASAGDVACAVFGDFLGGMPMHLDEILRDLAALAHLYGLDLNEAAEGNIQKLKVRYPAGWSSAASLARVDVKEA